MFRRVARLAMPVEAFGARDRRITAIMWTAGVVQGYAAAHAVNTEPFARLSLSLSTGDMSRLFSITRIGALIAVAFAWWGDRHGRRRPFLVAFAVLAAASASTSLATTEWHYAAAQTVTRLGATATGILGAVILIESVSVRTRAYAVSLYGAAASLGAGLATMALPLADLGPEAWRMVFGSSAVGLLLIPLLAGRIEESATVEKSATTWYRALPEPSRFWLLAAASLFIAAFSALAVSFSIERLVVDLGWSATRAAVVSLSAGTLGGLGFFVGGRLSDSWGRRPTAMVGIACGLVGGVGLFWVSTLPLVAVAVFISAFGSFTLVPALGTLRTELFDEAIRMRAVTWVNNLAVLGSVAGLTAGAIWIDRIGLPRTVTALGASSIVAIALIGLLPETLQPRPNPGEHAGQPVG